MNVKYKIQQARLKTYTYALYTHGTFNRLKRSVWTSKRYSEMSVCAIKKEKIKIKMKKKNCCYYQQDYVQSIRMYAVWCVCVCVCWQSKHIVTLWYCRIAVSLTHINRFDVDESVRPVRAQVRCSCALNRHTSCDTLNRYWYHFVCTLQNLLIPINCSILLQTYAHHFKVLLLLTSCYYHYQLVNTNAIGSFPFNSILMLL